MQKISFGHAAPKYKSKNEDNTIFKPFIIVDNTNGNYIISLLENCGIQYRIQKGKRQFTNLFISRNSESRLGGLDVFATLFNSGRL